MKKVSLVKPGKKYKLIYNETTGMYEIYSVYGILIESYKNKVTAEVATATLNERQR